MGGQSAHVRDLDVRAVPAYIVRTARVEHDAQQQREREALVRRRRCLMEKRTCSQISKLIGRRRAASCPRRLRRKYRVEQRRDAI
jgi:hypothetical protein